MSAKLTLFSFYLLAPCSKGNLGRREFQSLDWSLGPTPPLTIVYKNQYFTENFLLKY